MTFFLRLLEPSTDADLYAEAYSWRDKPKSHIQPDRLPFDEFIADRDDQITIGLFNGELQAVYFLHETEPSVYQAHFTSKRGLDRDVLLIGAAQVASDFFKAGATMIHAWVTTRNRPLRNFLETLGFTQVGVSEFPCQPSADKPTLPLDSATSARRFVKYVLEGGPS